MKITVTVDASELYSEEEGQNFSEAIKGAIAYDVKQSILKDFKEKIGYEFNKAVAEEVEKHKQFLIQDIMNEMFIVAKVKKNYSNEMVSISEFIKGEIERTSFNSDQLKRTIDDQTKKASSLIAEELKKRYDILFASQIVSKLNEQGMLKEDVAKILLG